jgi:hypothetical protein
VTAWELSSDDASACRAMPEQGDKAQTINYDTRADRAAYR